MYVINIDSEPFSMTLIQDKNTQELSAPKTSRQYHPYTNFNDKCLFIGGGCDSGFEALDSVEMYDIDSNTW